MRIISTSGAVEAGRLTPCRTASSSASLSAESQTSKSRIWPVNMGFPPQFDLPTYIFERGTDSGKFILFEARSMPSK